MFSELKWFENVCQKEEKDRYIWPHQFSGKSKWIYNNILLKPILQISFCNVFVGSNNRSYSSKVKLTAIKSDKTVISAILKNWNTIWIWGILHRSSFPMRSMWHSVVFSISCMSVYTSAGKHRVQIVWLFKWAGATWPFRNTQTQPRYLC